MIGKTFTPAVWNDDVIPTKAGPIQTGLASVGEIVIDGIQFRSWLPDSKEHCDRINDAGRKLIGAPPQLVLE